MLSSALMRAMNAIKKFTSDGRLFGIALVLGLLVIWEASVRLGWVNTPTWPAVTTIFGTFWDEFTSGVYVSTFGTSLKRLALGYVIAGVLAITFGIAMGI